MSGLKTAWKVIGGIEDWIAMIAFVAMTVVTIIIVICRYVLKVEFMQGEEIARYLMIWCGYAGAAYGFRHHSHVGVVVFAEMMPKSLQPHIVKIRHILSVIIVVGLLVFASLCFKQYLSTGQLTTATRVPTAYVYCIIPISMALGVVHTIVDLILDFKPALGAPKEVTE